MRKDNYLSVLMCQLDIVLDCDFENEFLVLNEKVISQIKRAFEIARKKNPDIILFPEMAYVSDFDKEYENLSSGGKIVIAGSYYDSGINKTVIFCDTKKYEIKKEYSSGAEPMSRNTSYKMPEKFIKEDLESHKFNIKGKNIYILNCMEYYHAAYFIARNEILSDNLFGIFAICSNSNTHVFEEETIAICNHNESIYQFVLNCISKYKGEDYADGKSYIYGPISIHEKEWLKKEGIMSKKNPMHILSLTDSNVTFLYGEFIFNEILSRFGRSDKYINNPRNITLYDI